MQNLHSVSGFKAPQLFLGVFFVNASQVSCWLSKCQCIAFSLRTFQLKVPRLQWGLNRCRSFTVLLRTVQFSMRHSFTEGFAVAKALQLHWGINRSQSLTVSLKIFQFKASQLHWALSIAKTPQIHQQIPSSMLHKFTEDLPVVKASQLHWGQHSFTEDFLFQDFKALLRTF